MILEGSIGNHITCKGSAFTYFGGNNYLGLANHRSLKAAAVNAIRRYGVNFSASRRTTGTADLHLELEHALSEFKNQPDTVVFASGYLGNSILQEVFRGSYTRVLIDELAHPSLWAGISGGLTEVRAYRHCDTDHLERLLQEEDKGGTLVLTDGVFALTGEIAPLDRIFPLVARYRAKLIVDEAHSTGILGENGRGTTEYYNLEDKAIYQTETMSKALGSYGGFISGSRELADLIRKSSSVYGASTALPPPVVAAGIAALHLMRDPGLRKQLRDKAVFLKSEIGRMGFTTNRFETPVVPVFMRTRKNAEKLSAFLEERGIIAPSMNYPGHDSVSLIRIAVSVLHTRKDMADLLTGLNQWKHKNGTDK